MSSVWILLLSEGGSIIEKQTKNRNEIGPNLSLGERLTRLSKRLSRKRCCDTTPDRCLECIRLTILLRILSSKCTKVKDEYAQRRRLRRINSLPKVKFSRLERLYQTQKWKASLSKVQALKFILQIAASKLENCVFSNSNLQILSSKSKSPLFFCQLVQLQVLYKGILAHFEKMSFKNKLKIGMKQVQT